MVNCEINTRTMNVLTNSYITNTTTRVFNSLTLHMILSVEIKEIKTRISHKDYE